MITEERLLLDPYMVEPSFSDWKVHGILNPGGIRDKKGKIILYARVAEGPIKTEKDEGHCPVIVSEEEYRTTIEKINKKKIVARSGNTIYYKDTVCILNNISHLRRVVLDRSGLEVESIDGKPTLTGKPGEGEYGVEDARITKIGSNYYMTYVAVSKRDGVVTCLAKSDDLVSWERKGIIFQEQNKDCVLFPEKINGLYVALTRPESSYEGSRSHIWLSYSPDLVFWGKEQSLLLTRERSWESRKNGAGPPPIKTDKGWLVIYHGVREKENKSTYSASAALLDLKNPGKVLARSPPRRPLFKPTKAYERTGYMNNVVFPTAAILDEDKKSLLIYSGGADSVISVRKMPLKSIFASMEFYS